MSDKIIEAVNKLDVTNDNHWTLDGLPRLETIRILTSNPGLSREDINDAMPGFKRPAQNSAQANETPTSNPTTTPAEITAPAQVQAEETQEQLPVLTQTLTTETNDLESLQIQLEDARANMVEASITFENAKKAYAESQDEFHRVETLVDKLSTEIVGNPIQAYLAQQQADLQRRAELRDAVLTSGLDLKDLLTGVSSPLDASLNSRKRHS